MDPSNERIERLLVLLLLQSMKGTSQREKVIQLNIAGFSNFEIAEFLNTSPPVVATLLYQSKKSRKPKKRRS
jgi:DNA-binding CsgD family transcriptional regulator